MVLLYMFPVFLINRFLSVFTGSLLNCDWNEQPSIGTWSIFVEWQWLLSFLILSWIGQFYRELSGFGFVKFRYLEDATVAKCEMNHQVIGGREISIVYARRIEKRHKKCAWEQELGSLFVSLSFDMCSWLSLATS
jgi:hypothetical protein